MSRDPDPDRAALTAAPIPSASVARLAAYLHVLRTFRENGVVVTSSGKLATAAGVNPAILRKDLSHVGANGVRGVGYDVGRLTARIGRALHTTETHNLILAGAGHLGRALVAHTGFGRGFRVVAMVDSDPAMIGTTVATGDGAVRVEPMNRLSRLCDVHDVDMAVLATADAVAQQICDVVVAAGVRQILNVTTVPLHTPENVHVRPVDFALELQVLAFNAARSPVEVSARPAVPAPKIPEPGVRQFAGSRSVTPEPVIPKPVTPEPVIPVPVGRTTATQNTAAQKRCPA